MFQIQQRRSDTNADTASFATKWPSSPPFASQSELWDIWQGSKLGQRSNKKIQNGGRSGWSRRNRRGKVGKTALPESSGSLYVLQVGEVDFRPMNWSPVVSLTISNRRPLWTILLVNALISLCGKSQYGNLKPWPNGFASRRKLTQVTKLVNFTRVDLICDQLVLICVGGQNVHANFTSTKLFMYIDNI